MPVQEGYDTKGCYWQYGKTGKKYRFKCGDKGASYAAMQKAELQGKVIERQQREPIKLSKAAPSTAPGRGPTSNYGPRVTDIIPGEQPARIPKAELKVLMQQKVKEATPTNDEIPVVQPSPGLYDSLLDWFKGMGFGRKSESAAYLIGSKIETARQEQQDTRPQTEEVKASEIGNLIGVGPNVEFKGDELVKVTPDTIPTPIGPTIEDDLIPESTEVALPQEPLRPLNEVLKDYFVVEKGLTDPTSRVLDSVWEYVKEVDIKASAAKLRDAAYNIASKIQAVRDAHNEIANTPVTPDELKRILGINVSPIISQSVDVSLYEQEPSPASIEQRITNAISDKPESDFLLTNRTETTQRTPLNPLQLPEIVEERTLPLAMPLAKMPSSIYNPFLPTIPVGAEDRHDVWRKGYYENQNWFGISDRPRYPEGQEERWRSGIGQTANPNWAKMDYPNAQDMEYGYKDPRVKSI